jgi:hypothetical protein
LPIVIALLILAAIKICTPAHKAPDAPVKTLKQFLQIALQPVGETMYIWGGGWNMADNAAGPEAMRIGCSPRWKEFFSRQTSAYSLRGTAYMIHDGLDCTGYLGWALYNLFPNDTGYVTWASNMVQSLVSRNWGLSAYRGSARDLQAGDIMGNERHVWISLGVCADGSAVMVHASPPGVMINGTRSGYRASQAAALAEQYMRTHHPVWYARYPNCAQDESYLYTFDRFRWSAEILPDPDGYRAMRADAILADLFRSVRKARQ